MTSIFLVNAVFEGVGAILTWNDVRVLARDRGVRGVWAWSRGWWSLWGFSNLWYYDHVNDPFSFWAGAALACGNTAWCALALWHARGAKARKAEARAKILAFARRERGRA